MKIKKVIIGISVLVLALGTVFGVSACANYRGEAWEHRTINIGFEGGACQAPIALAHLMGFFEEEGLTTQLRVTGDFIASRDLLASGAVDVAAGMLANWFVPMVQGVDARITMGLHTGCASAYVLAGSSITDFQSGQRIFAQGSSGAAFHNIGRRFLYRSSLSDNDVTWLNGTAAAGVSALLEGTAEVAILSDQTAQRLVDSGELRRIRSLDDADFIDESCCVIVMRGDFIERNPVTSEKINRAIYRAARWMGESEAHKIEAVTRIVEAGLFSGPDDIVPFTANLLNRWQWGLSHAQTEATLDVSIAEFRALGLIDHRVDLVAFREHIWRPSYLEGITDFTPPMMAAIPNIKNPRRYSVSCCAVVVA